MTKLLIAYFSQTGSTKKIADQIGKGLRVSNFDVTWYKITQDPCPDLKEFDIIGIGTPTYFFRPPFIVTDFVKNLKGLENKATFLFVTHGTNPGSCGNQIRKELANKGSIDIGYFRCFGADYWIGYIKRGTLFSPESPTDRELSAAELFGKQLSARYADPSQQIEKYDPPVHFMYRIERFFVIRPFAKSMSANTFYADKKCDNCGVCIKRCPVDNIHLNEKGKLVWAGKCLLCATCELSCPKDAIHSALDWPVFSPFMYYNIARSKNKKVPFANVSHKNGKTVII